MRRSRLTVAALLLGLVSLSACSTGSDDDRTGDPDTARGASSSPTTDVDADAFPVTIKHAFGETTVDAEPQRVVTIGWTDTDDAVALGVVPVGATKLTWGGNKDGSSEWVDEAIEEMGGTPPVRFDDTDGAPVDEIAKLAPDLILATNSGLTKADYEKLSKIAPVVAYPENPWVTSWEESLEMVGRALGRTTAARQVEREVETQLEVAERDNPQLKDKTFVFTAFDPANLGQVSVYGEDDPRVEIVEELGLESADVVEKIVKDGAFYGTVSAEQADTLDSDVLITYADGESEIKKLADNPLIGKIPALAAGKVAWVENESPLGLALTNPTPLSIPVIIEEFVPKLAAVTK